MSVKPEAFRTAFGQFFLTSSGLFWDFFVEKGGKWQNNEFWAPEPVSTSLSTVLIAIFCRNKQWSVKLHVVRLSSYFYTEKRVSNQIFYKECLKIRIIY